MMEVQPPIDGVAAVCDICNLNCSVCAVRSQRRLAKDRVMPLDEYKQLLTNLPPQINLFTPTGFGEITLHPDFEAVIDETKKRFPNVALSTNGTLIKDHLETLLRVNWVTVSLDASNPEQYMRVRGVDLWSQVIDGIRMLIEANHPHLALNFVAREETIGDIPSFMDLAHGLGVKTVNLLPLVDTKTWRSYDGDLTTSVLYGRNKGLNVSVTNRGLGAFCISFWVNFVVDIDWNVRYCCVIPPEPAGNLKEQSWSEIWYGEKMMRRRSQIASKKPPKTCVDCPANKPDRYQIIKA